MTAADFKIIPRDILIMFIQFLVKIKNSGFLGHQELMAPPTIFYITNRLFFNSIF